MVFAGLPRSLSLLHLGLKNARDFLLSQISTSLAQSSHVHRMLAVYARHWRIPLFSIPGMQNSDRLRRPRGYNTYLSTRQAGYLQNWGKASQSARPGAVSWPGTRGDLTLQLRHSCCSFFLLSAYQVAAMPPTIADIRVQLACMKWYGRTSPYNGAKKVVKRKVYKS